MLLRRGPPLGRWCWTTSGSCLRMQMFMGGRRSGWILRWSHSLMPPQLPQRVYLHPCLKQGRAAQKDKVKRAQLHRLMVWSKPSLSSRFSHPPTTVVTSTASHPPLHPNQGWVGRYDYITQPSKPGDRTCSSFIRGMCNVQ